MYILYICSDSLYVYIYMYIYIYIYIYIYMCVHPLFIRTRTRRAHFSRIYVCINARVTDVHSHISTLLLCICSAIISAVDSLNVNAHLYILSLLVLVRLRHVLAHHDLPLSSPIVVIDARAAGRSESRQVASRRADSRPKGGLCDCLAPTWCEMR